LAHIVSFDKNIDEYKYEIKEFDRLIEGIDILKVAAYTLERDKREHYFNKYLKLKDNLILKNKDILENILKKRRLRKAKMLHQALLRNKLKTPKELEEELEEENEREYFYVKKKEFFVELDIEHF
jgi:hypothetical protein